MSAISRSLPVLNHRFAEASAYAAEATAGYALLPMRFLPLDEERRRYVLTNFAGEYLVVSQEALHAFIRHKLPAGSPLNDDLKARHFLIESNSTVALDLLAAKYRTKQSFLAQFTSLFMFVITLRCEHSCPYCQVSRQSQDRAAFDMSRETADQAIDFMFCTPSQSIKVEFQGGESLLNFELLQYIVQRVEVRNEIEGRDVQFVVATNLAVLTDEMLRFCSGHDVFISTSLDGPRELHNANRPRPGHDSYEKATDGIRRVREQLGPERVSALMTTTEASLSQPEAIIDEYVRQGFGTIFLRPISPYGFAVRTGWASRYDGERFLTFYKRALAYILELNYQGVPFREEYASLVLRKMLTPWATGYVDLQSPAGMGISGLVFNYDGAVYASDEARMLAETGDRTFRLGNLATDSYEDVMLSEALIEPLTASMAESVPMCADCGVLPYCGSDPVYHHATQRGDAVGFKPSSDFCRRNMGVIRHLIQLLEDDPQAAAVLRTWA